MTTETREATHKSLTLADPHREGEAAASATVSAFPKTYPTGVASLILSLDRGALGIGIHLTPNGARELAAALIAGADHADPPVTSCATCGRPLGGSQTHEPTCPAILPDPDEQDEGDRAVNDAQDASAR